MPTVILSPGRRYFFDMALYLSRTFDGLVAEFCFVGRNAGPIWPLFRQKVSCPLG